MSDKYDAIQMDPLIMSAARAPAAGDPIAALNLVALRDDAPALALRGIAMARLATSFERKLFCEVPRAPSARKRLSLVRGVLLPSQRLRWSRAISAGPRRRWNAARVTLEEHGDWLNAAHARECATEGAEMRAHIGS